MVLLGMVALYVARKRHTTTKLFAAPHHLALVWPAPRMRAPVPRKRRGVCKGLGAHLALVWASAGVHVDVHLKCTLLDKTLGASRHRTCERALLRVDPHMPGVSRSTQTYRWRSERRENDLRHCKYGHLNALVAMQSFSRSSA